MSRPDRCRVLLENEPRDGRWNMAVDEALLESALERGISTLRWYRWSEPTVSLGYFQDSQAAGRDERLVGLSAVRRLSGGGAILHHHEWTYTLAVPADHPLAEVPGALYDGVHERILAVLGRRGIEARLRGDSHRAEAEPFLCFARGDARDIVLDGHKIVGSAQRRRRSAILQHGSILLGRSRHAPEFPGIVDLRPRARINDTFAADLAEGVGRLFEAADPSQLTADEHARAEVLARERYNMLDWSRRPRA